MDAIDIDNIIFDPSARFASVPCNSSADYEIAESINADMENVRREFQAKVEASGRSCFNFRFSRC